MPICPPQWSLSEDAPESVDDDRIDDDRALVAAAQRDPTAFTPLYERYVRPIYRYCAVRLDDHELAKDATSEIFLKALMDLESLRNGLFAAWLFRIAHNVVVDIYRRRRPAASLEAAVTLFDAAPPIETQVEAQLDLAALRDALALLPDDQRATLELQLADWSGKQIAETLGKSPAAVKMLRYRALQRLRRVLLHPDECPTREVDDVR